MINFDLCKEIAQTADVSTLTDCAVVYSISYLPTKENRDKAYAFVEQNLQMKTLDHTPCGQKLIELGCGATNDIASDKLKELWAIASKRFIMEASGNITAFVNNADQRSTFVSIEQPCILENKNIQTINGIDKTIFFNKYFIRK